MDGGAGAAGLDDDEELLEEVIPELNPNDPPSEFPVLKDEEKPCTAGSGSRVEGAAWTEV